MRSANEIMFPATFIALCLGSLHFIVIYLGYFHLSGSSDFGNVSRVVPSIKPTFGIGSVVRRNTVAFTEAAGTDTAHGRLLLIAIINCMVS